MLLRRFYICIKIQIWREGELEEESYSIIKGLIFAELKLFHVIKLSLIPWPLFKSMILHSKVV